MKITKSDYIHHLLQEGWLKPETAFSEATPELLMMWEAGIRQKKRLRLEGWK